MKDNKEFINDIYKKYDEYKTKEKNKMKLRIKYISYITVLATVVIVSILGINIKKVNNNNENLVDVQEEIKLAKVGSFENFYNILKKQEDSDVRNDELKAEQNIDQSETVINDSTYSTTNIQETNVDEADIVKTDGKYIYYIIENKVVIINIQNKMVQESEIIYTDKIPKELYIKGNKLIVITYGITNIEPRTIYETKDVAYVEGTKQKTAIITYDVQDRKNPKEERKIEMDGTYLSSRMLEDSVYVITNKYLYSEINTIKHTNLEDLKEEEYKPTYIDTAIDDEEKYIEFNDIRYFDDSKIDNYLIVCGFNIKDNQKADIQTYLGAGDTIYCSDKNMYILKTKEIYDINTYSLLGSKTQIIKFNLDNGKINYKAENTVEGRVLNQFSADEDEDENLRIAVTKETYNTQTNSNDTNNKLFILDKELNMIGNLENLANGENIYSVRFMGEKAYIVTYKQVDPLFVIDLSDPQNPTKQGELKIPGYSTYLHPFDETHIIGFGYDTNNDGTRNINNGLKLSMFDVTDMNNPKELFTEIIGNSSTYSEATYNHKAILYINNIMALPISDYRQNTSVSEALIYEISIENGFNLKGKYTQNTNRDYNKKINRIIYANDGYYILSNANINKIDKNNFKTTDTINFEI